MSKVLAVSSSLFAEAAVAENDVNSSFFMLSQYRESNDQCRWLFSPDLINLVEMGKCPELDRPTESPDGPSGYHMLPQSLPWSKSIMD